MKLPSYEKLTTEKGFFSLTPIMSRGKHLNVIVGQRSSGKSTATALFVLREYLATGYGWVYTRRTKDECLETCEHWFDNAVAILRGEGVNVNVEYKGGSYYVEYEGETKEAGRVIALSQENKAKGENLSMFKYIIFDEFINKNGNYLGGRNRPIFEYQCLISLYQTSDRSVGNAFTNSTYIICLGNLDSYYNPVFRGAGIDKYLTSDAHFICPKNEEFAVQIMREEDSPAIAEYKQSVGYKLSDKRTKEYAYGNVAKEAYDNDFICKITEPMENICNLAYDGNMMQMLYSWKSGILYIKNGKGAGRTYALTADDHTPNYWLVMSATGAEPVKQLKVLYEQGRVRFASHKLKYYVDNYLKFVI